MVGRVLWLTLSWSRCGSRVWIILLVGLNRVCPLVAVIKEMTMMKWTLPGCWNKRRVIVDLRNWLLMSYWRWRLAIADVAGSGCVVGRIGGVSTAAGRIGRAGTARSILSVMTMDEGWYLSGPDILAIQLLLWCVVCTGEDCVGAGVDPPAYATPQREKNCPPANIRQDSSDTNFLMGRSPFANH